MSPMESRLSIRVNPEAQYLEGNLHKLSYCPYCHCCSGSGGGSSGKLGGRDWMVGWEREGSNHVFFKKLLVGRTSERRDLILMNPLEAVSLNARKEPAV